VSSSRALKYRGTGGHDTEDRRGQDLYSRRRARHNPSSDLEEEPPMNDPRVRSGAAVLLVVSAITACTTPLPEEAALSPVPAIALEDAGRIDLGASAFVVQSGGWDALFSDPRDAGLLHALGMLDERLLELPEELGGQSPPPGTIEFLHESLSVPWTLRVNLDAPGEIPVRATWWFEPPSAERAAALSERLASLLQVFGLRGSSSADHPTWHEIELPNGTLTFGTADGGRAFLIAWGEPIERAAEIGTLGLPEGVRPCFVAAFGVGSFLKLVRERLGGGEDEELETLAQLGFGGDERALASFAVGHGTTRAHIVSRHTGWAEPGRKLGLLAEGPIPPETFALVPEDSVLVSITRKEPAAFLTYLEQFGDPAHEILNQLEDRLHLDLHDDLLEPLGQTFGFYLSDSTGGGDLSSAVAFAAVDDEARLAETIEGLAAQLNELAIGEWKGRVRVRDLARSDARGFALDFPGLPVPLSPCLALAHGHLFATATPQALEVALACARGRGLSSPSSWCLKAAAAGVGPLTDLQAISFLDTPRLARLGYGSLALLVSGLANGLRSPNDAARDPGAILPGYTELFAGAQPTVTVARVVGPDLVSVGTSDRSALLHASSLLGWVPSILPSAAVVGGMGALLGRSRSMELEPEEPFEEETLTERAESDIAVLWLAVESYASENDGTNPESLALLKVPDEDGWSYLDADASLVDPWGNPYVYELTEVKARIVSYGADGVPGGEGAAMDITSDGLELDWDEGEELDWGDGEYIEEESWESEEEDA
jgi:general secretion pathway protein G